MKWLIAFVAAVGLLALAQVAPAQAEDRELAKERDPWGDLRIYEDRENPLSRTQLRSIDIRWADVTDVGSATYEFRVRLKRLAREQADWDQVLSFWMWRGDHFAEVTFSQKVAKGGYAVRYDAEKDEYVECTDLGVWRSPKKDRVRVFVPRKCVLGGGSLLSLTTWTGVYGDREPAWSSDRMRFGERLFLG